MSQHKPREAGSPIAEKRRIVIITGLSGAGKSNALQAFEDAGYFCIDNLPPRMIPAAMETAAQGNGGPDGVVVVMDIRGRRYFGEELERSLEAAEKESGWDCRVLFIESDDRTLVRRYKESRRPHPAARNGDVLKAIRDERRVLANLREKADLVVDTSGYSALDARLRFKKLAESFSSRLTVSLISFGFKHGTPLDVDTIFDVRFMPNPHYDPELRPLTGHDAPVRHAVLGQDDARTFLEKTSDLLSFLIPRYAAEGKTYFTLGVGCTGGRHRSVVIVEELAKRLRQRDGDTDLFVRHRDLEGGLQPTGLGVLTRGLSSHALFIVDCPNLWGYVRDLYHIQEHYYRSHERINLARIVAKGPIVEFSTPHGREDVAG